MNSEQNPNRTHPYRRTLPMTYEDQLSLTEEIANSIDNLRNNYAIPQSESVFYRGFLNSNGSAELRFANHYNSQRRLARCIIRIIDHESQLIEHSSLRPHPSGSGRWSRNRQYFEGAIEHESIINNNDTLGLLSSYIEEPLAGLDSRLDSSNNTRQDISDTLELIADEFSFEKTKQETSWRYIDRISDDKDDPIDHTVLLRELAYGRRNIVDLSSALLQKSKTEDPLIIEKNTYQIARQDGEYSSHPAYQESSSKEQSPHLSYSTQEADVIGSSKINKHLFSAALHNLLANQKSELDFLR